MKKLIALLLFGCLSARAGEESAWRKYGTPVTVEESRYVRRGPTSIRVVTDNRDTMGGNYEGISRYLGTFDRGDLIKVSFWFRTLGGKDIVVGMGPTYFQVRQVLPCTDWTRAEVDLRVTRAGHHTLWISQCNAPTEFFVEGFSLEVTKRPRLGMAESNRRMTLTRGPLRLTLCKDTGALCGIENPQTQQVYAPVGQRQPLFGLEVLSADGLGYDRVPFQDAVLTNLEQPAPGQARISFKMKSLPIQVQVDVSMNADGSAEFRARVHNGSDRDVMTVEIPIIDGVSPAEDPANLVLVNPDTCGRIVRDAARSSGCSTRYPGRAVMGWMDLSGERGGLYLATHDPDHGATHLSALPTPEARFDLSLTREVVIRPGEDWRSPGSVLAVHQGDWHASADRYHAWMRTGANEPRAPQWMRDDNGWVLMGVQNGIPFRRIPDIFRQAQWMGIEYMHVQGEGIDNSWYDAAGHRQMHTLTYPYPSPKYGTVDELKRAVSEVHAQGGHIMFYFVYERWTPSHETSDDFGTGKRSDVPDRYRPTPGFYARNALVELPGTEPAREHPFMATRTMCLAAPGWQEWMRHWAVDIYAKEFGADGFYWDVMGRTGPFRCFNANHDHAGENGWGAGCAQVLDTVLREGRRINPDYSCAIEGCSDHLGRWVGYHLMSGATQQPNVYRFTFPEHLTVDGLSNHYWDWTDVEKARRVFLNGEKFDIHGYHKQIKAIIDLRRRVKPFIDWPSVFRDTVGVKPSSERVEARVFLADHAMAVTLMNEDHVEGATVEVTVPSSYKIKTGHLFHLDGSLSTFDPRGPIPVPKDDVSCAVFVGELPADNRVHAWLEQVMEPGTDGVMLNVFAPVGVEGLTSHVEWPDGFRPKQAPISTRVPGWQRILFRDPDRLHTLKRWTKIKAHLNWKGGSETVWTVLAPPLVNGGMDEIEDGRLVYWGVPPHEEDGRSCLKLEVNLLSQLTPLKPHTRYQLSCAIKRTGKQWAGAHVVEYETGRKGENAFVRSAVLNSSKIGEWETLETTFTTHPWPRSTAIYLYNSDREHAAFFDSIEINEEN